MNQIILDQADIEKLSTLIGEVPYKHAVQLVMFLNEKIAAQQKARAAAEAPPANPAPPAPSKKNGKDAQATA